MAPLHCDNFSSDERRLLLRIARDAIIRGCTQTEFVQNANRIKPAMTNVKLARPCNSFVTLTKNGELRGCIGSAAARDPLPVDVARNAFNSAFRDPRFPAVSAEELTAVMVEIAVLTPAQAIPVDTEADLLSKLRPQVDGLTIEDDHLHATFLPKVWEQLPDPQAFLTALKTKAGMLPDHWSPNFKAYRYQTESFSEGSEFTEVESSN